MNLEQFDRFCGKLTATRMVVQWSGAHVHKVGGKLFALANHWEGEIAFILKASPLSYEVLREQGVATRAPYLTRGNWVRIGTPTRLSDAELAGHIEESWRIVAGKLPKVRRVELGIMLAGDARPIKAPGVVSARPPLIRE